MVLNIVNILLAQYFFNNVQYFDFNRGKKRQNRKIELKNRKIPGADLKCRILKSSLPQRYESTSRLTCFPSNPCLLNSMFASCCKALASDTSIVD